MLPFFFMARSCFHMSCIFWFELARVCPHSCHRYVSNVWGGRVGIVAAPISLRATSLAPSPSPYSLFIINILPHLPPPILGPPPWVCVSSRRFAMLEQKPRAFCWTHPWVCVPSRRFAMFYHKLHSRCSVLLCTPLGMRLVETVCYV